MVASSLATDLCPNLWDQESARPQSIQTSDDSVSQSSRRLTDQFIEMLQEYFDRGMLKRAHLETMFASLKSGNLINPISNAAATTNADLFVLKKLIDGFLSDPTIVKASIEDWIASVLQQTEVNETQREDVVKEVQYNHLPIKFHRIEPEPFRLSIWLPEVNLGLYERTRLLDDFSELKPGLYRVLQRPRHYVKVVTLPVPFLAMSSQVTLKHWVDVMGDVPSNYRENYFAESTVSIAEMVRTRGDYPIEYVSWESALVFANRFSRREGYDEVYDFSGVYFADIEDSSRWLDSEGEPLVPTKEEIELVAARGDLKIIVEKYVFPKIRQVNENIYLASGYRLPTSAEQQFMRREISYVNTGRFYSGIGNYALAKGWVLENAQKICQPVAMKDPFSIGGNDFYDLLGNVYEMSTGPRVLDTGPLLLNPFEIKDKDEIGLRIAVAGSSAETGASNCDLDYIKFARWGNNGPLRGFRLVRSIVEDKAPK